MKIIKLSDYTLEEIQNVTGLKEENLELIEEAFNVSMSLRGDELHLSQDDSQVVSVIDHLLSMAKRRVKITTQDVLYAIKAAQSKQINAIDQLYDIRIARTNSGKLISPKTIGQRDYYYALKDHDVVFAIGPAGTGKTYLAVVFAVQALKNHEVKKIVLTRPAVEAGESLGFLPGDLKEKVDPYLRPLYDALYDMLGQEQTERLIEKGIIEIAPLAYMRGRTLDDAYVILDEAQNTTINQMKMFLTRLGFQSKMIITGDISQIDLPRNVTSGLRHAESILKGVKGIHFIYLSAMDVVRHPVVARIIARYDEAQKNDADERQ